MEKQRPKKETEAATKPQRLRNKDRQRWQMGRPMKEKRDMEDEVEVGARTGIAYNQA